ncbi:MAG: methylmalonyl-CoA mutase [Deltaproteobacteria bacterium]|nr:methylmalonyl-CoA mutase [Deltaproteobacteria bacterium]
MAKKKDSEKGKSYTTLSDLEIKEVYGSADLPEQLESKLASPGRYPFTRGIHSDMYRGKLWTMRQYAGFGTALETNKRFRFLLEQGSSGLSVAFDLPTQMGRDPDHAMARGEVGRVGVSIARLEDMRTLLSEIPLDKVSISMTINATAPILLAFLLVVAEERGVPWGSLTGTVQNDILKEYVARGTYIYPPRHALRLVSDLISFCKRKVPRWNTISISGYHMREAGCTAVQELAFTIANAICYVESVLRTGMEVDQFAPRLAFFFNCHMDFLEEIAKFRAARRMWASIMKERFKAKKAESMMMRFHTQTAGSSLAAQQPLNNIVRTTIEALAAVLGGTQSLHTNSYDEALGLPTENSAQIALRTQQIIAHESGVSRSVDPLAGSYLIENWTDRLEQEAFAIIRKIDEMGGMLNAIEKRFPQDEIERAAYNYHKSVEDQIRIIVGVNQFGGGEEPAEGQKLDPKGEEEQRVAVIQHRKARGDSRAQDSLSVLASAASTAANGSDDKGRPVNFMELIVECVKSGCTLGEISDAIRSGFGEYRG